MANSKSFWIVWNDGRTEGFVTDDERDAKSVKAGRPTRHLGYSSASTAGMAFREAYEDDALTIEKVTLAERVSA